jgi:hypothetical protein
VEIELMREHGMSLRKIAPEVECSVNTMLAMVNSYAVARPRAKKPVNPRPNISIAYISGSELLLPP